MARGEEMSYVVVIERIRRCRSCFIYSLSPTRYLWLAKLKLKIRLLLAEDDCNWAIVTEPEAQEMCLGYRNWMGENRVGG
jgi:hypothetical protein